MKLLISSALFMCLLSGCINRQATFNVTTKNFPRNSVISIYSPENGVTYLVENITNKKQTFKVNFKKKGYVALKVSIGPTDREFWFYINSGTFEAVLNANDDKVYPFVTAPNEETEQFRAFYKLKRLMGKKVMDSVSSATLALDKSTSANVEQRARNLDFWMEKRSSNELNMIETFAKKYPSSLHTLFLLDQLGQIDTNTGRYVAIFNSLDKTVKESEAGKNFVEQVTRKTRMMAGNIMPEIEGQNPQGANFEKKILKKVNLVIVWTSYNTKIRENTKLLTDMYKSFEGKDVEFIGISLDKRKDWWLNVIADDKLSWPQYSDLKGAKSPNAKNLSDYNIPYFFIIDKNAKILMNNDLRPEFIRQEIEKRL